MTVHYPPGVKPCDTSSPLLKKEKSKKPKSVKTLCKVAPGNRGIAFEEAINRSNEYYREKGLCIITKRPTPIRVVKVDYTHGPKITSAFYEKQSTTDYNGVYEGHYIDFEAKETRNKTAFPLANIPLQQIDHLEKVMEHGGIAFFLIHFVAHQKTFLLPAKFITAFYREKPRASIPYSTIEKEGILIEESYLPPINYLPALVKAFAL